MNFFFKYKDFIIVFFLLIIILDYFYIKNNLYSQSCFTKEQKIIRGGSMEPLFHDGDKVSTLKGYYNCHNIGRGDIVLIDYPGDKESLIIKSIKGVPDDKIDLIKGNNSWNILINGEYVVNSKGEKYSLTDERSQDLRNDQRDFKGIIPTGRYLILGELNNGTMDSTMSGLFLRQMIKAKVILYK